MNVYLQCKYINSILRCNSLRLVMKRAGMSRKRNLPVEVQTPNASVKVKSVQLNEKVDAGKKKKADKKTVSTSDDIEDVPLTMKEKIAKNLGKVTDAPETWVPENWMETLNNIREMRKNKDAPVDSMGCDKCMDQEAPPHVIRFQSLISLMLSSQTKDEVTYAAMSRLKNHRSGLTIDSVLEMNEDTLGELIRPVGFWKQKVKYIKQTCKILKEKYNSDIPNTAELLCTLPGVGPKMAFICMSVAWGVVSGIGVDTHVHRISNRVGWVKGTTKTPEATRHTLESWLPKELWKEVNNLLVGFGQQTCKAINPLCSTCANLSNCQYGQKEVKNIRKKK